MVVGAAGNDVNATLNKDTGHCARVLNNLLLVRLELRFHGFLEGNGLGRNHVHQRPSLVTRKNSKIQFLLNIRVGFCQDQAGPGAAQGLVGRGRRHVRDVDRAGIQPGGDQAGHVGDIGHQVCADLVGDLPESLPVQPARVRGEACHHKLRPVFQGKLFRGVIINLAGIRIQAVLHRIVDSAGDVDRGTMGQVAAVGKAHSHDGVSRLAQCQVNRAVGLGTGMGLDIGVIRPEQLLRPVDGELFDDVDIFTAAIIAFAGITFCILVGQHRTLRLQHPGTGVVFRCYQFNVFFLPGPLPLHGPVEYVVVPSDFHVFVKHTSPYNFHVKTVL